MGRTTVMTEEVGAKAVALLAQGLSGYAIGEALGVDPCTVRKYFRRVGAVAKPAARKWAVWEDKLLEELLLNGSTYGQITIEFAKRGSPRTENGCQNRASKIGLGNTRPKPERRPPVNKENGGWPVIRGDFEVRDAKYVRLCLEGLAQIYRVAA